MPFTCTVDRDESGVYVATSLDMDLAAEGLTREAAVDALRREIVARLRTPDAVAPPSSSPVEEIELVVVPRDQRSTSPPPRPLPAVGELLDDTGRGSDPPARSPEIEVRPSHRAPRRR